MRQLRGGAILRTLGHLATGVGFRGHHCHQVALALPPVPPSCPRSPPPTPPPATSASLNILCLECPSLLFNFLGRL